MIDLTRDSKYKKGQVNFKNACKELKGKGKGVVKSYPEIKHKGPYILFIVSLKFKWVKKTKK